MKESKLKRLREKGWRAGEVHDLFANIMEGLEALKEERRTGVEILRRTQVEAPEKLARRVQNKKPSRKP